jgi:hypothetical protein
VVISPGWVGRHVVANCGLTLDLIFCVGSAGAEVRDGEVACGAVQANQAGLAGRGSSIGELAVRHHVRLRTVRQARGELAPQAPGDVLEFGQPHGEFGLADGGQTALGYPGLDSSYRRFSAVRDRVR